MKKIKSAVLALALFAMAFAVEAQNQYTANAYTKAFTNTSNAISYTGYPALSNLTTFTIGPLRQKSVTVQLDMFNDSASATVNQFGYKLSTDGVTFGPLVGVIGFSQSAFTGTGITNIDLQGCGYFQITGVTNTTSTGQTTNGTIRIPLNFNAK